MKRLIATLLLCVCATLPARVQDAPSPDTLKAAQELAGIMTGDTVQQMTGALVIQMWPGIEGHLSNKVDAATLTDIRAELERLLGKFVGDALKDAPALYARHFTADELHDLVAFYKSPTGAKTLRELPKVTAESYGLIAPRLPAFQQEIAASVESVIKKHGYKD
jgi:uncharacterized protein